MEKVLSIGYLPNLVGIENSPHQYPQGITTEGKLAGPIAPVSMRRF